MHSRLANEIMQSAIWRQAEKSRGVGRTITRFSAHRSMDVQVPDRGRMPVLDNETSVQNADGGIVFTLGYSALGLGHKLG